MAQALIDAGANLDIQDNRGWTPLHLAAWYPEEKIARMLIDAGARKDIKNKNGRIPYDLAETEELKKLLKP